MQRFRYGGRRRRPVIEDDVEVSAMAVGALLVLVVIIAVALWCALADDPLPSPKAAPLASDKMSSL